jgi:hypothetical protein
MRFTPATLAVTTPMKRELAARHMAGDAFNRNVPVAEHDARGSVDVLAWRIPLSKARRASARPISSADFCFCAAIGVARRIANHAATSRRLLVAADARNCRSGCRASFLVSVMKGPPKYR